MTSSSTEVSNSKSFASKVLPAMTPEYFKINNANSKSWRPSRAFEEFNLTRIFDRLPEMIQKPVLSADEILDFYQNVYAYGYEYAFSQVINPLIEAIVDIKNQKLHTSFIEAHIGFSEEELLAQMKALKIKRLFSDVKVDKVEFQSQHPQLREDSEEYETELKQKKIEEATKLFYQIYGNDKNFNKQMNFELAHGFTDACKVLFSSCIMDSMFPKTEPYKALYIALQGHYDMIQNIERTGLLKLYKAQKYHIGPEISADINRLAAKWPDFTPSLASDFIDTVLENSGDFFKKEENQIFTIAFIQFNYLSNEIVSALNNQIKALIDALTLIDNINEELAKKINAFNDRKMSLSERYHFVDELNTAIAAQSPLSPEVQSLLEQANKYHKFISKSNQLLNKYERDHDFQIRDEESKMRRYTLTSLAISIIAVAAVITLTVTTFGAGAALIPFIPAMISAGVAAASAIGAFAASIYFGLKYQKTSQLVVKFDEQLSETPQSSSEDRDSVSSNASTVLVHAATAYTRACSTDSEFSPSASRSSSTASIPNSLGSSVSSNASTEEVYAEIDASREGSTDSSRANSTDSEGFTSAEEEKEESRKSMRPGS